MKRRAFLKNTALTTGLVTLGPGHLFSKNMSTGYFGLHSIIEENPEAVFIFKTNIHEITDGAGILSLASSLGSSIFVPRSSAAEGFPVNTLIPVKPNLNIRFTPGEGSLGVQTDVNFTEGIINSLKRPEIGIDPARISIRETHTNKLAEHTDYITMCERTGVDLTMFTDWTHDNFTGENADYLNRVEVPDGEYFKSIPYLSPFGLQDSFLINIAKLKSHWIGVTGCAKNLQGTMAKEYVRHCFPIGIDISGLRTEDINPNAYSEIMNRYKNRKVAGLPGYDKVYSSDEEAAADWNGPVRVETWITRCLDNHQVLKPAINILEGIYSREGAVDNTPNQPADFTQPVTNIVLFGKNPFAIDVIATYLAGHEPGNFGWLHTVFEKNIAPINPFEIPLYEWSPDGIAELKSLDEYSRFKLRCKYLPQQGEEEWHMVDEPFDYTNYKFQYEGPSQTGGIFTHPGRKVLQSNFPNPFRQQTTIRYNVHSNCNIKIDILDETGRTVDILKNEYVNKGTHMVGWDAAGKPAGLYFCRLITGGITEVIKMQLIW